MPTKLPDIPKGSILAHTGTKLPPAERMVAQQSSVEKVEDPRYSRPVPRFITELPFGGDDDEITDRIASQVLFAEDPDAMAAGSATIGARELVGQRVTIHDLRAMDGNLEGGWGAYLLLDVTVKDSDEHLIVNTGAKQIVTRLARCWAEGQLPVSGAIAAISRNGGGANTPLAFVVEPLF